MTTTMTTIQEMLREISSKGVSVWGSLQIEAANRIDALEAERDAAMADARQIKDAVAIAYGHLWHVNNEPMASVAMRHDGEANYAARKILLDCLTHEERGGAINTVRQLLEAEHE